jgi:hypothetical protein
MDVSFTGINVGDFGEFGTNKISTFFQRAKGAFIEHFTMKKQVIMPRGSR